ncbi:PQQ-binding-like beta-propeller repeat protein [Streptosporangium amethystogenes]|uniref:outer membrane protein assembly factor BamB family protein n=1 Tax=Streptosporangium amethystogenes TaxID=2002 RepID=UPI0037B9A830
MAVLGLLGLLSVVLHSAAPGRDSAGAEFSEAWSLEAPAPLDDFTLRLLGGDLFVRTRTALRIHDPATGTERWRYTPVGSAVQQWTAIGSTVIVKTFRPSPSGDIATLTGLSRATGAVLWSRERLDLAGPAPTRSGPEEDPPVVLALNAQATTSWSLLGLVPETGQTRWTFRLSPSCDRPHTASSTARTTAIVAICAKEARIVVVTPSGGAERWSTGLTSFADLHVQGGVVAVSRPGCLLVHDAGTGRVIAEREGCWGGCSAVQAGGRIVVTHDQDGVSTIEGIDPADGSVGWTRVQRNGPRYARLVPAGEMVYAVPSGDGLGQVLDVVRPSTGELRRVTVPTTADPVEHRRKRLHDSHRIRGRGSGAGYVRDHFHRE